MRRRLSLATALTVTITALAGCGIFGRLSGGDIARCDLLYNLPAAITTQEAVDQWNEAFADLANSGDQELAGIGDAFNKADLRSIEEAGPYRDKALVYCDRHGWDAPAGSGPASPSAPGQPV